MSWIRIALNGLAVFGNEHDRYIEVFALRATRSANLLEGLLVLRFANNLLLKAHTSPCRSR